jgi:magnesium chelatase family protein
MLVRIRSAALSGIDALPVEVETDVSQGLPSFTVVGLAGGAVREGADRVRAAVRNAGLPFPSRKVTVNLAPADLRKEGGALDLPIALSLLCAEGVIPAEATEGVVVTGELALDGSLRPSRGALAVALLARDSGFPRVLVPSANGAEAALVPGVRVVAAESLARAVEILAGRADPPPVPAPREASRGEGGPDLSDVKGQAAARRALEVAAAGGHALLLSGPPGCGKTMLAERLPGLLPPFRGDEALETARIYGASGEPPWPDPPVRRPFRAPHHSVSAAGLVGGGNPPRPGEISYAHGGVLFLDEFGEFRREAREALREPLETGEIRIARAGAVLRFPARFHLVAATNPCPCGNGGHPRRVCRCPPSLREGWTRRLSGPLLDRVDLSLSLLPLEPEAWTGGEGGDGEDSAAVRRRVEACREVERRRFGGGAERLNGTARGTLSEWLAHLDGEALALLRREGDRGGMSGREAGKVCRVARTAADLAGEEKVRRPHVAEALSYRFRPSPEGWPGAGRLGEGRRPRS